jgi:uncharacterized membrane protein
MHLYLIIGLICGILFLIVAKGSTFANFAHFIGVVLFYPFHISLIIWVYYGIYRNKIERKKDFEHNGLNR